jgi:uncharacterized phage protein (TIGR02218 family)
MRTLPDALAAHLAGEATTTCHCWRVTRRDGQVLGFTEHDRDLVFAGTTFQAASGFAASEADSAAGLAASAEEVSGGFSSAAISEQDLATGRFDGARVELFLVNWADPEQHLLLNLREIGEVVRAGGQFRAELRSLAHKLNQPQGRVYTRRCDATLGDARCGVNLDPWRSHGAIVSNDGGMTLRLSGMGSLSSGFFDRGRLQLADGTQADIGAAVTVTAGCDKSFSTCRNRFDNHLNFRGFPHMPGSDFAYSYADGERVHDGGPIFE